MLKDSSHLLLSFFITTVILFSLPFLSKAQSSVTILEGDRIEGGVFEEETIRKILENVRLQTEEMTLAADSVYQFLDRNLLIAYNTQIETETDVIWADTLYYNTHTDFSRLRGRVIIQSESNIMFSDSLDVDQQKNQAIFDVPVRFEDPDGTLIAGSGIYFQEADSAVFRGNVQLSDSTQYLEADSLFMNRSAELYELFGNVYADDFQDDVKFSGEYLYADSTGYRLLEENAWMMEVSDSKADTTHLTARRIVVTETDTTSYMEAYTGVAVWSTRFAALADTAHYRDDLDQFILRHSPRLWQKNIQLTGPYVEIYLEEEDIRFLVSHTRPIIVQEDSVTSRLHQMAGDTLYAHFDEGDIVEMQVFDNAEIIFHQHDDADQPDGLIELSSAGPATMYFIDGEIDEFKAEQSISGSYLPEDPSIADRQLSNFSWDPELKPERPGIRQPRLPSIPIDRPFELPPRFIQYLLENETESQSDPQP